MNLWPPTRTLATSIGWAIGAGFLVQLLITIIAGLSGLPFAWYLIYPGLFPILYLTGGFFAGLTPLGLALLFLINTFAYGILIFMVLRCCCHKSKIAKSTV